MALKMKMWIAAVLLAWLPSVVSAATIIVVRHAEFNGAMSADPSLNAAGKQRAELLARMLADAGIRRIYVATLRRTQETAAPLAEKLHLTPVVIAQDDTNGLLKQLRSLAEGETVLVVGRASTVPLIVKGLGAGDAPAMSDAEFDRMTVITTSPGGHAQALLLRFGAISH